MNEIISFIHKIKQKYELREMPFLDKQRKRMIEERPYEGYTVLHNTPFTKETVLKLENLYLGGATITVTSPSFMEVDPELVKEFVNAGGTWLPIEDTRNAQFDFHLDCAAELMDNLPPKIGAVEITGTGTNKYAAKKPGYPVISIDKSKVKNLEGVLGTGEAFVRAFEELTEEDVHHKHFMVFGYGKVGKGIAHYLRRKTQNVIVVDKNVEAIDEARNKGFEAYPSSDCKTIERLASKMYAIVTATGINNVISDHYDATQFTAPYLANMGGEDEFGDAFPTEAVMCQKRPINFFVDKPTLMHYLDPVFYAHNMGIDILNYMDMKEGLHAFPSFLSEEIVTDWMTLFDEKMELL